MPRLVDPVVAPGTLARLSPPVLDVGDVVARPWRSSDAPTVAAAYAEPDIQQWHARSMTGDESRQWIVDAQSAILPGGGRRRLRRGGHQAQSGAAPGRLARHAPARTGERRSPPEREGVADPDPGMRIAVVLV